MDKVISKEEYLNGATDEFLYIVKTYLVPLIDMRGCEKLVKKASENKELVEIHEDSGKREFYFYPSICISPDKKTPFFVKVGTYSGESIKKRLSAILSELLKAAEYNTFSGKIKKQRDYGKNNDFHRLIYKEKAFQTAFEFGMCNWIVGPDNTPVFYQVLSKLQEWSAKTYEGKKVPFGVVINLEKDQGNISANYIDFLDNDNSAVFTDGIFSGIEIDKNGGIISFITSYNSTEKQKDSSLNAVDGATLFVPYQYTNIARYCYAKKVGIIVLISGEIIIVKDGAICFAKRGNRWVSYDWTIVNASLKDYFLQDEQEKIKEIYCSLLDVSFSHTGGCLAIVKDEENISKIIKERLDLYIGGKAQSGISATSLEKMGVLKYLLHDKNQKIRGFFDIDQPLRKEIMSMDGAVAISPNGHFFCCGTIVAVSGGSSGGGRTAATKKLAELGVGIKISEDGYIEAYGQVKENEKVNIVPLFKIK